MIQFRIAISGFVILSAISVGVLQGADSDATPEISPTAVEAVSSPTDVFQSNSNQADDCIRRADRHFNAAVNFTSKETRRAHAMNSMRLSALCYQRPKA